MRSTPPRLLPTLALTALWIALYFLWLALRPAGEVTVRRTGGATAGASTTTTAPPLLKFKP